jgi:hypothetical protein
MRLVVPTFIVPRNGRILTSRVPTCHVSARFGLARPAAVNLIEGTASELVAFLDEIAYTDLSTPGTRAIRDEWQALTGEKWWGRRPKAGS